MATGMPTTPTAAGRSRGDYVADDRNGLPALGELAAVVARMTVRAERHRSQAGHEQARRGEHAGPDRRRHGQGILSLANKTWREGLKLGETKWVQKCTSQSTSAYWNNWIDDGL